MNEKTKLLIRSIYQSIPTEGEKAAFQKVLGLTSTDKVNWILSNQSILNLTEDQRVAIMAATRLTKEDRVAIAGGLIRRLIFKIFGV